MCRVLQVSRSDYYEFLKRPPSCHRIEDDALRPEIQAAFKTGRKNYGTRHIKRELKKQEIAVSRRRIGELGPPLFNDRLDHFVNQEEFVWINSREKRFYLFPIDGLRLNMCEIE